MNTNSVKIDPDASAEELREHVELYEVYWREKYEALSSETTTKLMRGSINLELTKKENIKLLAERNDLQTELNRKELEVALLKEHLFSLLEQWEDKFDSDEEFTDRERMEDYVRAASFSMRAYGRKKDRIHHVQERIDKLPF